MVMPIGRSTGIQISGLEESSPAEQALKWDALMELEAHRNGPLRVDRVPASDGAGTLVFLRKRTWPEFFIERLLMKPKRLAEVESDTRAAIAHALDPCINQSILVHERARSTVVPAPLQEDSEDESASELCTERAGGNAENGMRSQRLKLQRLQAAVCESRYALLPFEGILDMSATAFAGRVELAPVHGLRKCPPGVSVVPFSPLTLICNCLFVGSALNKAGEYDRAREGEGVIQAFKGALARQAGSEHDDAAASDDVTLLPSARGLRHVENLWLIREGTQPDTEDEEPGTDSWSVFYSGLLVKAATVSPYGSTVLEPYPSHWADDDGMPRPVWTDQNVEGLALAVLSFRDASLATGKCFQSITLAITDAELRARVQRKLIQMESGLFAESREGPGLALDAEDDAERSRSEDDDLLREDEMEGS
jgi:hypothetical protein